MSIDILSEHRCFGGRQIICRHLSTSTATPMQFAIFLPPERPAPFPVLWFLSGLTCTEANFITKAGAQRVASHLGLALVVPDTSPRGDTVPRSNSMEIGEGAGFYLDASRSPWSQNFLMRTYLEKELPKVVASNFPLDLEREGIMGHSMGGHGALTISLRNPDRFRSVSAFAPICAPSHCPWGQTAFTEYLGVDQAAWEKYDACRLIESGAKVREILVDQGTDDVFLQEQLRPELLNSACSRAGIHLTLRYHEGYDHSYFFVSTFIEEHLLWHADRLC